MTFQIWVLEKPINSWLIPQLIGDFAVRAFASYDALWLFYQILGKAPFHAILVNRTQFGPEIISAMKQMVHGEGQKKPLFEVYKDRFILNCSLEIRNQNNFYALTETLQHSIDSNSWEDTTLYSNPEARLSHRYHLDFHRLCITERDSDETVSVTLKELKIIQLFFRASNHKVTRSELIQNIWVDTKVGPRTLDCHISRLRKKIEKIQISIESNYRDGYTLNIPAAQKSSNTSLYHPTVPRAV